MNRRSFVRKSIAVGITGWLPWKSVSALPIRSRVRPGDQEWPNEAAWDQLRRAVNGKLTKLTSPLTPCVSSAESPTCKEFFENTRNPYYIQDDPTLTETSGWLDAWSSQPSAYVVTPTDAAEISKAVTFSRKHNLRLVVKGGGHSYMGNSNAPDSLLIWTHQMKNITMLDNFVPKGAPKSSTPVRAVTLGAGVIWEQAYDAVTTKNGAYVQGGGCTTVGVAGLVQGGGFGSFSKYFGLAASGLLEAEVVTADGKIRTVNAYRDPDLFWALKGGGGGTFAVVSQLTLRVQELPQYCGGAMLTVKASSDEDFKLLIREFVEFYRTSLMNPHWGESASLAPDNTLHITMMHVGLSDEEAKITWKPFLDWIEKNSSVISTHSTPAASTQDTWHRALNWAVKKTGRVSIQEGPTINSGVMRETWNPIWDRENRGWFTRDPRPGASPIHVWYKADTSQVGFFLWDYDSVWLPAGLLEPSAQLKLVEALFSASRCSTVSLHFNKGLAGAPAKVIEEAKSTAMNPAVCEAFALAICAEAEGPAYAQIRGHAPNVVAGRKAAASVQKAIGILHAVAPKSGAYISEASYFGTNYQAAYWGENFDRLARTKRAYDPDDLFFVHHGIGSERWSPDGFTRS